MTESSKTNRQKIFTYIKKKKLFVITIKDHFVERKTPVDFEQ